MPRYFKQNGKRVPNLKMEKAWIVIPVKSEKGSIQSNIESYLVQTRVADYIVLLESKIKNGLPKLSIK